MLAPAGRWPAGIDWALLRDRGPLGLAVSGGSDSTALAVFVAEAGVAATVLSVDHGLRKGAAQDVAAVGVLAGELGLPFVPLKVTAAATGSLQDFARRERYGLLAEAARVHGLRAIVTAHTLEDQAETVLLRLARGSGLRGLAAMRPVSRLPGSARGGARSGSGYAGRARDGARSSPGEADRAHDAASSDTVGASRASGDASAATGDLARARDGASSDTGGAGRAPGDAISATGGLARARDGANSDTVGASRASGDASVAPGDLVRASDGAMSHTLGAGRGADLEAAQPRDHGAADGILLLRPFLSVRREALREALRARGIGWREDPSNDDTRFDRVAMRRLKPQLDAVGLSAERLASVAGHLARASAAIDGAAARVAQAALRTDRAGGILIDRALWAAADEEVRLRILSDALHVAGGADRPVRFPAVAQAAGLCEAGRGRTTAGRCVITVTPSRIELARELRGIEAVPIEPGGAADFDGRFRVFAAQTAPPATLAPLSELARRLPRVGAPRAVAAAPGVFVEGTFQCAPSLGVRRNGVAADLWQAVRLR